MKALTKENFDESTKEGVSLIKFGADWCGPCKKMKPVLEEVEDSCDGINFFEVDVDNNAELAQKYGIRGIPFILKMENGEGVGSLVGVQTKETIQKFILDSDNLAGNLDEN